MDRDALLLELPELDIQSILAVRNFIESFLFEFDAHYYAQLREYYCSVHLDHEQPF